MGWTSGNGLKMWILEVRQPCGHSEGERELNWGEVRRVGKWKQLKRRQEKCWAAGGLDGQWTREPLPTLFCINSGRNTALVTFG